MTALPRATVTFLFTDVEGSTRLLHELGDAYPEVLAEHRRALRDAFVRHEGAEVDTQATPSSSPSRGRRMRLRPQLPDGPRLPQARSECAWGVHTGEPLDEALQRARAVLGAGAFAEEWKRGRALGLDGVLALALQSLD